VKPIIFLKIPRGPFARGDEYVQAQNNLTEYFDGEYHVLCVPTREEEFEMQVFNDPNLTPANFDQLKEMIENELYNLKYPHEHVSDHQAPPAAAGFDE
jgi:hypothetical protein